MSSEPALQDGDWVPGRPCAVATVDDQAWAIVCGADGCGEPLAACSWQDVQFYMILNSNNEAVARRAMQRLPRPQYRTYRLCAEFAMGWKLGEDGIWRETRSASRRVQRAGAWNLMAMRVIHGRLTSAALQQEAEPPAHAECPRCGSLNVIQRTHRVGLPGYTE
jgi:hypothetical protein